MASTTPYTIVLRGSAPVEEKASASGQAITPGDLLGLNTSGELIVHGTAGGPAVPMFAVEDPYNGVTGTAAIDVDYASAEWVKYVVAQPGDEIYAWLEANGSVNAGQYVQSNGAGAVELFVAGSHPVALALESVNGQTVAARIKLKIV